MKSTHTKLKTPVVDRRQLLEFLLGFSIISTIIGVFMPIIGYLVPPPSGAAGSGGRILAGTTSDIPLGQGKVVPMGNKPVIVVNISQGIHAFSAVCTHLGCICQWDEKRQIILCPCHDGQFNPTTGAVISGPPPKPLPTVPVTIEGEEIYIGEA